MSAKYKRTEGFIFLTREDKFGPEEVAYVVSMFDFNTDYDCELSYGNNKKVIKHYKKTAILEILQFPFSYLFTLLFSDKRFCKRLVKYQKIYWKFLMGKYTIDETHEELQILMASFEKEFV